VAPDGTVSEVAVLELTDRAYCPPETEVATYGAMSAICAWAPEGSALVAITVAFGTAPVPVFAKVIGIRPPYL
jgi:hypothetical protein